MKCPFTIAWREITPEVAKEWLKKNTHNRALRSSAVNAFARDLRSGAWFPHHQGIAFAADGRLLDGQHRLSAVVASGVSMWAVVFSGIPDRIAEVNTKVMDTIDRGSTRSIADLLHLEHGQAVNPNHVAACCQVIGQLCSDSLEKGRATMPQTVGVLELFREGLQFAAVHRPKAMALRSAVVAGAVAFAYAVKPKVVGEFYARFTDGAGLSEGSPILTLRNHLQATGARRGKIGDRVALAELTLHALELQARGELMPKIPKPGERGGAAFWKDAQKAKVEGVRALFSEAKPVVTGKSFRILPAVDSLLRAKEISEKINRKVGRAS